MVAALVEEQEMWQVQLETPFDFAGSIVEDAMSSSLDVAASNLWTKLVSRFCGIVRNSLSMMKRCSITVAVGADK